MRLLCCCSTSAMLVNCPDFGKYHFGHLFWVALRQFIARQWDFRFFNTDLPAPKCFVAEQFPEFYSLKFNAFCLNSIGGFACWILFRLWWKFFILDEAHLMEFNRKKSNIFFRCFECLNGSFHPIFQLQIWWVFYWWTRAKESTPRWVQQQLKAQWWLISNLKSPVFFWLKNRRNFVDDWILLLFLQKRAVSVL